MDILAHGLWTAALANAVNNKFKKKGMTTKVNVAYATFWGIFPDLFAFTVPFIYMLIAMATGSIRPSDISWHGEVQPAYANKFSRFDFIHNQLAHNLYDVSHSAIIFILVFATVWIMWRRPALELLGWLLHILIDIPTHSYRVYPTPLFWPVSRWEFLHGFSWTEPWFMLLNYSSLALAYYVLFRKKRSSSR